MEPISSGAGWIRTVVGHAGDIELEQLDESAGDWLAVGPGGEAIGTLFEVVLAVAGEGSDPDWVHAVAAAVGREFTAGLRRSTVLVKRGTGTWYHVTFVANRHSIAQHGLDWRHMTGQGIAGSTAPEWAGIFLCESLEDARFFVQMGLSRAPVDVWAVGLAGEWLEGAPDSDGGAGENWMICPEAIESDRLTLIASDTTRP